MDDIRRFKPVDGRTVRDPATGQPLPPHGAALAWNSFWERRLADGDIEPTTAEAIAAAIRAAKPKAQGDAK